MGNQMEKALVSSGLVEAPKPRKRGRGKQFKCHICGSPMIRIEGTNVMACSGEGKDKKKHKGYFLFDEAR